ncbi:template-activating factor I [Nematocida displodere]|uniref:Template-activating factor I n=1 Tax=Nematocida displodere TaxID=1805483 RepID=A0A177ECD5_9MICR|nr:template-activating factor I [Nematocida displodere]
MNGEAQLKKLIDIQNIIDELNVKALKKDFLGKLEDYKSMEDVLNKRNHTTDEIEGFWEDVILNSEFADVFCDEKEDATLDMSWVDTLKVEYREDFKFYVGIKTKENEYFDNELLEKEFSLFERQDCLKTAIEWRGKEVTDNPLLRFFSSKDCTDCDDNMNMFHILSDLYVNSVYYYMRCDEEVSDEQQS